MNLWNQLFGHRLYPILDIIVLTFKFQTINLLVSNSGYSALFVQKGKLDNRMDAYLKDIRWTVEMML